MNLFDAVMRNATSRRMGELTLVSFGLRGGAILVGSADLLSARKWAQQKPSTGNEPRDLDLLLGRLECYVARHGSGIAAKGSRPRLLNLGKALRGLGLDPEDWSFPREVADELRKRPAAPGETPDAADEDGKGDGGPQPG